jgi:hypothetical protein
MSKCSLERRLIPCNREETTTQMGWGRRQQGWNEAVYAGVYVTQSPFLYPRRSGEVR